MLVKGLINNQTTGINGYGITGQTISEFLEQNGVNPEIYNQQKDDFNDHAVLEAAIKDTHLDYLSPSDPTKWILYAPAITPTDKEQTVPTIAQIKHELISTISKLYYLKNTTIAKNLVEKYAGKIDTGITFD